MSIAIASDARLGSTHEEWLRRALAGDEGAFAWIVETFSSDMAQVCLVVIGDLELADEAVAAAWRTLGRLRDPERLRSWLISMPPIRRGSWLVPAGVAWFVRLPYR
jgi:hypothetical protein